MANAQDQVATLMYHRVAEVRSGDRRELVVSPIAFEKQVRWLRRNGYTTLLASEYQALRAVGAPMPELAIMLTFDDGYADLAQYALPTLKEHGFSATVFVVTGELGGINSWDAVEGWASLPLMSAEEIRSWADRGIEFGAHGRTHRNLTGVCGNALPSESQGSARELEAVVNRRITSFAYPYGAYDPIVRADVASTFEVAFTCDEGLNDRGTDPLLLRRTMVQPSDTCFDLICRVRLGWSPVWTCRQRLALRSRIKRMIGAAN
jgi:peptidoglycan/xylan/chitin deacetylase (PgdA/CDA1 family)